MIKIAYGEEVHQRVLEFRHEIETIPYEIIDPEGCIRQVSELPQKQKHSHPEFMSKDRYMAICPNTLHATRAFLYHKCGCNAYFQGNGKNQEGYVEYIALNLSLEYADTEAETDTDTDARHKTMPKTETMKSPEGKLQPLLPTDKHNDGNDEDRTPTIDSNTGHFGRFVLTNVVAIDIEVLSRDLLG